MHKQTQTHTQVFHFTTSTSHQVCDLNHNLALLVRCKTMFNRQHLKPECSDTLTMGRHYQLKMASAAQESQVANELVAGP